MKEHRHSKRLQLLGQRSPPRHDPLSVRKTHPSPQRTCRAFLQRAWRPACLALMLRNSMMTLQQPLQGDLCQSWPWRHDADALALCGDGKNRAECAGYTQYGGLSMCRAVRPRPQTPHTFIIAMEDAARVAKELFVSNNDGTSIGHVLSVLTVVPVSVASVPWRCLR
jgi:hypothetical protein